MIAKDDPVKTLGFPARASWHPENIGDGWQHRCRYQRQRGQSRRRKAVIGKLITDVDAGGKMQAGKQSLNRNYRCATVLQGAQLA